MAAFFRLFKCQLKRFFFRAWSLILFSTLFFIALAFIASLFTKNMSFSGNHERLKIGIVGDSSIPYFETGLTTLKYLDSSNAFVEILTPSQKEAEALMRKGKLAAYVIIPPGFIEAVENGSNDLQVTYVTAAGAQGIESLFKEHIADIVSSYLINAQAGIFAMERLALKNGQRARLNEYNYEMNMNYIKWTLDRKNFIRLQELPLSNGVGLYGYYLCSLITSFLIFFSIGCLAFFTNSHKDKYRFLYSKGYGPFSQILAEYLAYALLLLFCLFLIFILILIFMLSGKLSLTEWRFTGIFAGTIRLFTAAIPLVFMFAAMHFMLFEAVNQTVAAVLLQFFTAFCLSFTGGCFYPLDFFPQTIQTIGTILPAGRALALLDSSLLAQLNLPSLFASFAYTVIFIMLAFFIRARKIKGEVGL